MKNKTLHLTLHKKWFDKILAGEKKDIDIELLKELREEGLSYRKVAEEYNERKDSNITGQTAYNYLK